MEHSELFFLMFPKFPTEQKGQIKLYKLNKEKMSGWESLS